VAKIFSVNFGVIPWLKHFMACSSDHLVLDILYLFHASIFVFRFFLAKKRENNNEGTNAGTAGSKTLSAARFSDSEPCGRRHNTAHQRGRKL
jgi:hypothetical protein